LGRGSRIDSLTWDRCYNFKNIFAEKLGKNIGVLFAQTTACFCKNFIKSLVIEKNANFFRRKLAKFAENCDHSIDPWRLCGLCNASLAMIGA
jgi:hypothetical protein